MAINALTAQLPGALPDLFRRTDGVPARSDDNAAAGTAASDMQGDDQRTLASRTTDDITRSVARRAALGPLTYGRSMMPAAGPAAAPIGMRGAHLDVRG